MNRNIRPPTPTLKLCLTVCLTALVACSQARTATEETMLTIGTSGGALKSADGKLELTFPPGALPAATEIHIVTDRSALRSDLVGPLYRFSPDGIQFTSKVTLTLKVAEPPAEGDDFMFANTDGAEPAMLEDTIFDESALTVTVGLEHFSSYGLFRRAGRCRFLSCGDSCGRIANFPLACTRQRRCVLAIIPPQCGPSGPDAGPSSPDVANFPSDIGPADLLQTFDGPSFPTPDAGLPGDSGISDLAVFPTPDAGLNPGDAGSNPGLIPEIEPNDPIPQYIPLEILGRVTIEGTLVLRDVDRFDFQVPPGFVGELTAYTHSDPVDPLTCTGGLDTVLTLADSGGTQLASNDDALAFCAQLTPARLPQVSNLSAGTYTVSVRTFQGTVTTPYYLTEILVLTPIGAFDGGPGPGVDAQPALDGGTGPAPDGSFFPPTDAGTQPGDAGPPSAAFTEVEPNDTLADGLLNPFVVAGNPGDVVVVSGDILPNAAADNLSIVTTSGLWSTVEVDVGCMGWDPLLFVYTPSNTFLISNDDSPTSRCPFLTLTRPGPDFVLQITDYRSSGGPGSGTTWPGGHYDVRLSFR